MAALVRRPGSEPPGTSPVRGDLADIESCDAVLADFSQPDEGTAMEAWHAHAVGTRVIAYTGGRKPHPWTVYVAESAWDELEDAARALMA